jgi:hypothetical protein
VWSEAARGGIRLTPNDSSVGTGNDVASRLRGVTASADGAVGDRVKNKAVLRLPCKSAHHSSHLG